MVKFTENLSVQDWGIKLFENPGSKNRDTAFGFASFNLE